MSSESKSDCSNSSGSEKDHDIIKDSSDLCNSSDGSDHSIQVKFREHKTLQMIRKNAAIIILFVSVLCIALGVTLGFLIQHADISSLKLHLENTSTSLYHELQDIKLELLELRNKPECNTTSACLPSTQDSLMDLRMQIDEISNTQTDMMTQLNNVQLSLSNLDDQIGVLQVDTRRNVSRLDTEQIKHWDFLINISEHLNNLSTTQDEHGDQLSTLRSRVSSFSTQLNDVAGQITSLNSSVKAHEDNILSLQLNFTTLTTQVTGIISRQSSTVQQRFSDLEDSINSLQAIDYGTSIELNALKRQVDRLEDRLRQNYATIPHPAGLVIALSLLLPVF